MYFSGVLSFFPINVLNVENNGLSRNGIRVLRTSYFHFSRFILNGKFSRVVDVNYAQYLSQLAILSIGIQPFLLLNFKKYDQNCDNYVKYYPLLCKYLKKFVITNIKRNLNVNKYSNDKTCKLPPIIKFVAFLCLSLSYFVIGKRYAALKTFNKCKTSMEFPNKRANFELIKYLMKLKITRITCTIMMMST